MSSRPENPAVSTEVGWLGYIGDPVRKEGEEKEGRQGRQTIKVDRTLNRPYKMV